MGLLSVFVSDIVPAPMRLRDADAISYSSSRCSGKLWVIEPDMIVTRAQGRGEFAMTKVYMERADEVLARAGRLLVFHDWRGVTSWDTEIRDGLRNWALKKPKDAIESHFLVNSKVLAMAIQVAAMFVGRELRAHSSQASFERAVEKAFLERR